MPSIDVLIAFTLASLLLTIAPGPSNLYVMARSISQGARGGLVAAAGLAAGSLVHVVATVLGLSVVFSHAPLLYTLIKLAGAIYLIYLGIKLLRGAGKPLALQPGETRVSPPRTPGRRSDQSPTSSSS